MIAYESGRYERVDSEITPAFHVKKIIAVTMVTDPTFCSSKSCKVSALRYTLSIDIAMYDLRTEVLP